MSRRFQYWSACTDFSSGEIIDYVTDPDRSRQVSYRTFARDVDLGPLRAADHPAMYRISSPDNWAISFHRSKLPNGQTVYYFDWSRIEHMFLDPEDGWPSREDMVRLAQDLELHERRPSTDRSPNPTAKRLRWVADRYPAGTTTIVAVTLAEATGDHEAVRRLRDMLAVRRNETEVLAYAEERLGPHTRFDRHLPWLAREVDRLRRDGETPVLNEVERRFRSVVDWAEEEHVDLGRVGAVEALDAAERWAEQRRDVRDVPQGEVAHAWDDGWTVQELTKPEQLAAEGDVMQHCLAEYEVDEFGVVIDHRGAAVEIYSLRDPRGHPHATMELSSGGDDEPFDRHVAQLRGKQNAVPKPEYLRRMVEFRLERLTDAALERLDAPSHADGLRERFAGAFRTPQGDAILVYEDGTVLMADDFEDVVDDVRLEAKVLYPGDVPAQRQHVIVHLDQVEPRELASEDWARLYGLWLPWAVMVATEGRARVRETEDEMVNWLAGERVDPSVCRPFARRAANAAELFGRLTS